MPRTDVASIESVEEVSNGVRLQCGLDRVAHETLEGQQASDRASVDRTVPIDITFFNPETFRLELRATPETGPYETPMEFDEEAITEDVDVDVTDTGTTLHLATDALDLTIEKDPWSFRVDSADGTVLFEEQRHDLDAKNQRRASPLGFTEREVTNWPLQVSETGTAFVVSPEEHFFGLGEKFTEFDKRGQTIRSWTTQPNGSETEEAYKNVPFFLSSSGYGLLVDTINRVTFDLADTSTVSGEITVDDDTFSMVFFAQESVSEILSAYTALTGRPSRPPKWTFGLWMSKYGYASREELEDVTARLRAEEIPSDVVHLDPYWMRRGHECDFEWDREAFPDPEEMIENLHEDGFHLCLWENPYVAVGTDAFEHTRDAGYLVSDRTGNPYVLDRLSISTHRAGIIDFTNPDAAEWYKQQHRRLLEMGVDVFKTDFGEYLPRDAILANGKNGETMRNFYPHLYQQTVYETMVDTVGESEAVLWSRSGWVGSQRYPVHWPGDPRTTFESMGAVLRGGLSLMLSGYAFWSHDMGGFKGTPSEELYIRDAQFGLLTSHARFHGTTPREPWQFGETALEVVRSFVELRYRLIPYIYTLAEAATRTGLPVMRPLVLEYEEDPRVYDLGTQFLLGTALLVKPIMHDGNTTTVYLPDDAWQDWWAGERFVGPRTIDRDVPIEEVPLFQRVGSVVPMGPVTQSLEAGMPEEVELRIVLEDTAAGRLYDEDANEMIELRAALDDDALTLECSNRTARFRAVVDADGRIPDAVRVNDSEVDRVDADPDPGEWTVDGGRAIVNCP